MAKTGKSNSERKAGFLTDGSFVFAGELAIQDGAEDVLVTGGGWMLELFDIENGEISFLQGKEKIYPENRRRFGIFCPPFSIVRVNFDRVKGRFSAIAGVQPVRAETTSAAILFDAGFGSSIDGDGGGAEEIGRILNSARRRRTIEANPNPSKLALEAKKLIDENYPLALSIARLANRLRVTHEHLTRRFKKDFGLTPSLYLHKTRAADAALKLAKGEQIITVSHEVGYNDLSRFYKQFRKTTKAAPGECQIKKTLD